MKQAAEALMPPKLLQSVNPMPFRKITCHKGLLSETLYPNRPKQVADHPYVRGGRAEAVVDDGSALTNPIRSHLIAVRKASRSEFEPANR